MEHAHQLSGLAGLIASIRAQGRTARLALHNTERFGLIHLYFAEGRLIRVEGYAGDPARNLADLATWQQGAVRIDRVHAPSGVAASPDALEAELFRTLAELERRGVMHPAPPATSSDAYSFANRTSEGLSGVNGLPPLGSVGREPQQPMPSRANTQGEHEPSSATLTDPEWQLLALAVHQVEEHAGQLLGGRVADSIARGALAQAATDSPFLAGLALDETGWLRPRQQGFTARFPTFTAVEAIAALLTQIEVDIAAVVGRQRAKQLIATSVTPFRTSLEQIGLIVRVN